MERSLKVICKCIDLDVNGVPTCICGYLRGGNPFHLENIGCPRPLCSKESDHLFTLLKKKSGRYWEVICWHCREKRENYYV